MDYSLNKIHIYEVDSTTGYTDNSEVTDIVFVPGFADVSQELGAAAYVPTLCRDIDEFESYFGKSAPTFSGAQAYDSKWDSKAIPTAGANENVNANMFEEGDEDPGYNYAKELISRGLYVLYERMNETSTDVSVDHMYDVLNNTATTLLAEVASSPEGSNAAVTSATFVAKVSKVAGDYYFTASVSETATTWSLNGSTVSLGDYGLTVDTTYTAKDGDIIKVTVATDPESDVESPFVTLCDKGTYSVKYLTTGGYPILEYNNNSIVKLMMNCAAAASISADGTKETSAKGRGDCLALIDHTNNRARALLGTNSVFQAAQALGDIDGSEKSVIYTPWCNYVSLGCMPASFAYLSCLASSIRTNPSWLAIAGVTRGLVSGLVSGNELNTKKPISNLIADNYQPNTGVSINAITNVKPYGYCIWGNRTLLSNTSGTTASSFVNTMNMVCEIKKKLYEACKSIMFEQNSDVLWINFQSKVTPLLDKMATSYGLESYKLIKKDAKEKGKLEAVVRIIPLYAIEKIDITVLITDNDAEVEEE